jgi:hypothetical protein
VPTNNIVTTAYAKGSAASNFAGFSETGAPAPEQQRDDVAARGAQRDANSDFPRARHRGEKNGEVHDTQKAIGKIATDGDHVRGAATRSGPTPRNPVPHGVGCLTCVTIDANEQRVAFLTVAARTINRRTPEGRSNEHRARRRRPP